jgi:hypothetical protein
MVKEVTRYIKKDVERELWARAAGRCQFNGCNRLLYKSSVTQESVNLAQKAHIYSFSEKGPRGRGPFKLFLGRLNDISNLMLMCHGCHKKIDQDTNGERYSAELLIGWKSEHERRIEIVAGIEPDKKSHVIFYGANIGSEKSLIEYHACVQSMFPNWYPANERPEILSMVSELKDSSPEYWNAESAHLFKTYERKIAPLIDQDACKHFSIFALAPQPLLIELGALLTDKISVETYQLHREPKGWRWQNEPENFTYDVHKPDEFTGTPVLLFSLSDHVNHDRITRVLNDANIWEVKIENPHNDFMMSKQQLSAFRKCVRQLMVDIKNKHGNDAPLHIFPVMPVSCCIELGRARMPKAEMPWIIYDHDVGTQKFNKSIELRGDIHVREKK